MSLQPPSSLVELLERLGVATSAQILRAGKGVRRLSREVQQFDSVWIDALVRARRLTSFQAREINAGRGEGLKIGPYLICEKLAGPPYLGCYRAVDRESGKIVRLAVQRRAGFQPVVCGSQEDSSGNMPTGQVGNLSYDSPTGQIKNLSHDCGMDGERWYFAAPWKDGRTVAEWLVLNGRFPQEIVWEIARAMVDELAALEKVGHCHGDIAPWNVLITPAGDAVLLHAGLRGILRPEEGFAFAELLPEGYDYLAPERVVAGTPPNRASDIYACGCVWWQMLCGRPSLVGGDSLAKLRAVQTAEIPDVRRFSPDTPTKLAEVISACLEKDTNRRPASLAKLAAMLGTSSKGSQAFLARTIGEKSRYIRFGDRSLRRQKFERNWPVWLTAAVGCVAVMMLLLGPTLQSIMAKASSKKIVAQQRGASRQPAQRGAGCQPATKSGQIGNLPHAMKDRQVQPAGYNAPVKNRAPQRPTVTDFLLETKGPQSLEKLSLQRGQRAIGRLGQRATIVVPPTGLTLDGEEIRLENIDFIWQTSALCPDNAAMILYAGSRADFRGCRFFTAKEVSAQPVVVCWTNTQNKESNLALPSGRMLFSNCIFHRVGVALDCRRRGAIALDMKNCLLSETSALLQLNHQPELDEPIHLNVTQLTMHTTGPLFACLSSSEKSPGEFAVQAENCVFSLRKGEPLVAFEGVEPPDALLRNIRWDGASSLVAEETSVCGWKTPGNAWEALDDSTLSIAGLVRSRLEFAENAEKADNPAQSARLLHWQAPLPTLDAPGVELEMLPKGEVKKFE
jgi:serine/threonine protein kinase